MFFCNRECFRNTKYSEMETSILIARIMSISYLALALGLLVSPKFYKRELPKLLENSASLLYGGIAGTCIGYIIIHYHNVWDNSWRISISIIGWIALIKGILLLVYPEGFKIFKNTVFHEDYMIKVLLPAIIILGAFFGYFGFFSA